MISAVCAIILALVAMLPSQGAIGTPLLSGKATWYDTPGLIAAAGPDLRVGDWRGKRVKVCLDNGAASGSLSKCVTVSLDDACWCPDRGGVPVLLDLSKTAFSRLASPSVGVVPVEVEILGDGPTPTLPATDAEPGYQP